MSLKCVTKRNYALFCLYFNFLLSIFIVNEELESKLGGADMNKNAKLTKDYGRGFKLKSANRKIIVAKLFGGVSFLLLFLAWRRFSRVNKLQKAGTHVSMFVPKLGLIKPGQTYFCPLL